MELQLLEQRPLGLQRDRLEPHHRTSYRLTRHTIARHTASHDVATSYRLTRHTIAPHTASHDVATSYRLTRHTIARHTAPNDVATSYRLTRYGQEFFCALAYLPTPGAYNGVHCVSWSRYQQQPDNEPRDGQRGHTPDCHLPEPWNPIGLLSGVCMPVEVTCNYSQGSLGPSR
jgi:hypothetical protein